MTIHQILTKYWGHTAFRPLQEDIINAVLGGKDTLALLPTGGGKSICFQVPALLKEGICIVVSPLIALMKDQVENLKKREIPAVAIVSGMHRKEIDIALDNCIFGKTKFLYISPERLSSDFARVRIADMKVSLFAIDEAHCISQWGYDFRPSYLKIASLREIHPSVPVLALTATATPEVVADIQDKLKFRERNLFQKSFERKNLSYMVIAEESKLDRMLKIIEKVPGTGLVYVRNRRKTKEVAEYLVRHNVSADYYHAGLDSATRDAKQDKWIKNQCRVIVATNAFGMGIDKPNVRFVIHLDLPDSLEAYFQEAGRAGRDEKKAYAVLLYAPSDKTDLEQRTLSGFPEIKEIKSVYDALGNYFKVPVGSGRGMSFDFDISDFSNCYNFRTMLVYNSIKFLEREAYISSTEPLHLPSRIFIPHTNEELYKFQIAHQYYDGFIKLLLRSYSGLFTNYIKINESDVARRAETEREKVVEVLNKLKDLGVISYLPQTDLPQLTFTEERLNLKNFILSKENYDIRKKEAVKRMETVIAYATATRKCRSQLLLTYFGEEHPYRCGVCDVCLERNKLELSNMEFETVSSQIKEHLTLKTLTLEELVNSIKNSREDKVIKVVQWLMDNEKIKYEKENRLVWRK